jgi:hypothetical protein
VEKLSTMALEFFKPKKTYILGFGDKFLTRLSRVTVKDLLLGFAEISIKKFGSKVSQNGRQVLPGIVESCW